MSCKCIDVMRYMEEFAPLNLAQNWDNVGLMLGDPEQEIKKILISLDITKEIVDEAVESGADMIITHHPLIFRPLNRIRKDSPEGDNIIRLIKNSIAVYSAHTNLDMADGGVNDILAERLNLSELKTIKAMTVQSFKKIVVFVPEKYSDVVRRAIADAGAGHTGNYSDCCFITEGIGTFKPLEGSAPFIGQVGEIERVKECRIETIVPEPLLKRTIQAMLNAHPYEEPVYDVYNVENITKEYGFAKMGKLKEPIPFSEFSISVKNNLRAEFVKTVGKQDKMIQKVVVASGSYSDVSRIASEKGADVIVTGDLKYHDAQEILSYGMCAVDAGHFATENFIVEVLEKRLSDMDKSIKIIKSVKSKDIFRTI